MGLVEALSQIPETKPNIPCRVVALREVLTGDDLAAFNHALELVYSQPRSARSSGSHGATAKWLADTLTENGYETTAKSLTRHLRGECRCGVI